MSNFIRFLLLSILLCSFLTNSLPSNRIIKENTPEDSPYDTRQKRQIHQLAKKWEDGFVYYEFDDSINDGRKDTIKNVIDFISRKSCIKFTETNKVDGRIIFKDGKACKSSLGFVGLEPQTISLGKKCNHFGIVMHEIFHALGFHHTASRSDRDDYVKIMSNNTEIFEHNTQIDDTTSYVPYEYASIMHYPLKTDGLIIPKQKEYLFTIGSRIPTFYDMYALNVHYQCNEKCADKGAICYNKGYPNPNNCEECICPRGYSGSLCNEPDETTIQLNADSEWQTYKTKPFMTFMTFTTFTRLSVKQRSIWINAPQNGSVQIRSIKLNQFQCTFGCNFNGIQVQYSDDPRHNDPIQCCQNYVDNRTYTTKLNPAVINFHGSGYETYQFEYRYVDSSTDIEPSSSAPETLVTDSPSTEISPTEKTTTEYPQPFILIISSNQFDLV